MRSVLHYSIRLDTELEASDLLSNSTHPHRSDWILDLSEEGTEMSKECRL